jgi:ketosteroid isomerase-like protein
VVDRTGDVWSAAVESADASPVLASCARDALLSVVMQPPVSGIADVELGFVIRSARGGAAPASPQAE